MKKIQSLKIMPLSALLVLAAALAFPSAVKAAVALPFTETFDSYSGSATPGGGPTVGYPSASWTTVNFGTSFIDYPANGTGKAVHFTNGPGSFCTMSVANTPVTDFYEAIDWVDWKPFLNQALVLNARANYPTYYGITATKEYVLVWQEREDGANTGDRQNGVFGIIRVDSISPFSVTVIGAATTTLERGRSYRVVFTGVGTSLAARVYDFQDFTAPIVTVVATDATYASGDCGLTIFDVTTSGTDNPRGCDARFDNYYLDIVDPYAAIAPAIPHPIAGTPIVDTRTAPTNRFTNFHPPANGIAFTVKTFTANTVGVGSTKLYLNGVNVSASLVPVGEGTPSASYTTVAGTLTANTVYSARIEVADTGGTQKSTNTFWFDTFSDTFLNYAQTSPNPVQVIEAEDFNYSNGVYQLAPVAVSGIDGFASAWPPPPPGYYLVHGNDPVLGVDYSITEGGPDGTFNVYRTNDFIRTEQGLFEDLLDGAHPPGSPIYLPPRSQYAAAGLGGSGVQEYLVCRMRIGTWMNYTRSFANSNYNVYLRCSAAVERPTSIQLDFVGGNPTTTSQTTAPLGAFSVENNLWRGNFRYVPLTANCQPAVVSLSGLNTIRLTQLQTDPAFSALDDRQVEVNYMLFVPTTAAATAPVVLESTTSLNPLAVWAVEGAASYNANTKTITVAKSGGTRFYRLKSCNLASTITSTTIVGSNVIIKY